MGITRNTIINDMYGITRLNYDRCNNSWRIRLGRNKDIYFQQSILDSAFKNNSKLSLARAKKLRDKKLKEMKRKKIPIDFLYICPRTDNKSGVTGVLFTSFKKGNYVYKLWRVTYINKKNKVCWKCFPLLKHGGIYPAYKHAVLYRREKELELYNKTKIIIKLIPEYYEIAIKKYDFGNSR